jgi:hypothetical protein
MECVILISGFSIFCVAVNDAPSQFCIARAVTALGDVKVACGV